MSGPRRVHVARLEGIEISRTTTSFNGFKNIVTGDAAAIGMGAVPASLYAVGLIPKTRKCKARRCSRVKRWPTPCSADGFKGPCKARQAGPLPTPAGARARALRLPTSGAMGVFLRAQRGSVSVATIVARRYGNHRSVPYVAYSRAGLVGFSRLPLNVHFLSDVFIGGAIDIDQPLHRAPAITTHSDGLRAASFRSGLIARSPPYLYGVRRVLARNPQKYI